jgi:hypothetical protein
MAPTCVAAAMLALLPGCKDEKKHASAPPPPTDPVREATEQNLRATAPAMRFRGEQVYTQTMPQRTAVCGQLTPFPDEPEIFVPFVSIVTTAQGPDDPSPRYQFEHTIGTSPPKASRVYVAIVTYCYDKGGPSPALARGYLPPPPLPDSIADPTPKPKPAAQQAPPPVVSVQATGSVTMRQNANLHADPQGPSVRVVPQGTALHVFAQAPGGWVQVGDTAPLGWVHESMLDRHPAQ